jgi:hypothetical protein
MLIDGGRAIHPYRFVSLVNTVEDEIHAPEWIASNITQM